MGFMDKVKSTADGAVSALTDAVNDVSSKGKEMTAKARINKAIKEEESKINNLYMVIGRKVFEENETAPAAYADQFEGIKNAKAEIERLQNELTAPTVDNTVCPNCGRKITPEQKFCQGCGTNLKS